MSRGRSNTKGGPADLLPNYNKAQQIAAQELAVAGHNDAGDALRHARWSYRMYDEIEPFTAWSAGFGHGWG